MEPNTEHQPQGGDHQHGGHNHADHDHGDHDHADHSHLAGKRSGGPRFLLWVLIAAIIILVIAWMKPSGDVTTNDTSDTASEAETLTDGGEEVEEVVMSSSSFTALSDWELLERAESAINTYLGDGQKIEYGIVADPTDDNIVYFASSTIDDTNNINLLSIYKYRLDDYNFERIYRRTFERDDYDWASHSLPIFHVVGYENGNLVLFIEADINVQHEDCWSPYLDATGFEGYLTSVSLELPYDGFDEEYRAADEVVEEALAAQETCLAEME